MSPSTGSMKYMTPISMSSGRETGGSRHWVVAKWSLEGSLSRRTGSADSVALLVDRQMTVRRCHARPFPASLASISRWRPRKIDLSLSKELVRDLPGLAKTNIHHAPR